MVGMEENIMFDNYIEEVEKQYTEGNTDGYGTQQAWIDLPTGESADITKEDGYYSALLYDSEGNSMLPYINANSLYELFCELIGE